MRHTKIAIIGAGDVGSTTAYALMLKNVAAEISLIDIDKNRCNGEMLDLADALPFSDASKIKSLCFSDILEPDIIIISAGARQKEGQSRAELVKINKKIINNIIEDLKPLKKETIIIVVTNPVEAMTYFVQQASGLPNNQVFGTGTFLDSQRVRGVISEKIGIAEQSIHVYMLGEHGDSQFAAWSCATIAGVPIADFPGMTELDLKQYAEQARKKVYEIIKCKGATYFGIAACVTALCENIIFNQKRIAPVSVFHEQFGVPVSVPAVIGCTGIEKIITMPLNETEQKLLVLSSESIKKTIEMG